MSCKHGNWQPCDECIEEDAAHDRAFAAGRAAADFEIRELKMLLRVCDAALGTLSSAPPVLAIRQSISKAVGDLESALASAMRGDIGPILAEVLP